VLQRDGEAVLVLGNENLKLAAHARLANRVLHAPWFSLPNQPVIGDLLCLLAGWMRISWGPVLVFLCLGKALRYVLVAIATLQGMTWWH
jgi:membrane protein YqaA with SNARE-associated domain